MKALALIESPFHLLCVREAIQTYQISSLTLVIVSDFSSRNYSQIDLLLPHISSKSKLKIRVLKADTRIGERPSLYERIAIYGTLFAQLESSWDTLFFSDYRSQWQYDFVSSLNAEQVVMLDDGTATLSCCYYHLPNNKVFSLPVYGSLERQKEAKFIKCQFGMRGNYQPDISFFTIFEQHFPKNTNTEVNSLKHLSKQFSDVDNNLSVIVGSKIVERSFCDVDDYHDFIESVVSRCSGKVIYLPHRGQSQGFNDQLAKHLPMLDFLYLDTPMEYWISNLDRVPATFHGFISTAFFVLARCFPQIQLTCYKMSSAILKSSDDAPIYGTNLYTNSQSLKLYYDCLPSEVQKIDLFENH